MRTLSGNYRGRAKYRHPRTDKRGFCSGMNREKSRQNSRPAMHDVSSILTTPTASRLGIQAVIRQMTDNLTFYQREFVNPVPYLLTHGQHSSGTETHGKGADDIDKGYDKHYFRTLFLYLRFRLVSVVMSALSPLAWLIISSLDIISPSLTL